MNCKVSALCQPNLVDLAPSEGQPEAIDAKEWLIVSARSSEDGQYTYQVDVEGVGQFQLTLLPVAYALGSDLAGTRIDVGGRVQFGIGFGDQPVERSDGALFVQFKHADAGQTLEGVVKLGNERKLEIRVSQYERFSEVYRSVRISGDMKCFNRKQYLYPDTSLFGKPSATFEVATPAMSVWADQFRRMLTKVVSLW